MTVFLTAAPPGIVRHLRRQPVHADTDPAPAVRGDHIDPLTTHQQQTSDKSNQKQTVDPHSQYLVWMIRPVFLL